MEWSDLATGITVIGGPATIAALYKWARAQGRAEAIQEQSAATILALTGEIAELKAENQRLWSLVTPRQEKS